MSKSKKLYITVTVIILLFGVYNIIWYFTTQSKYDNFSKKMDEVVKNSSYVLNTGDEYVYNVKYPDYLTFTGNLGVSDEKNEISLIIWPSLFNGENEYRLRIIDEDESYEIVVDKDMKAEDSESEDIINKYQNEIQILFHKADEKWGIIE